MNISEERNNKLFYGYVVVAAGFCIMMVIHGVHNVFGVFFNPLMAEFNPSRAVLSLVFSVSLFTMGIVAILIGVLADKFGPRLVMIACAVLFGVGQLLMSRVSAIWQIYLLYMMIGAGLSAADVVPLATVVRWFIKKRGAMSGIMKVGTGMGLMVMPVVTNWLIVSFGWRNSYVVLGILVLVSIIPLAQLLRRDPGQIGQLPDGGRRLAADSNDWREEGLSLREVIQTRQFWMVFSLYTTILFCTQSILVHMVPHAVDLGVSAAMAAGTASTIGGASILGRLVMGFVGDRIGIKRAVVVCFFILVAALIWVQPARELWMLYLFAAVYGFSHGGFFTLISPMIAGLFGTRSQGTLLGLIIFGGTLSGGIGAFLTGSLFDTTGSYQLAFLILLIVAIIGLVLTLLLKPLGNRSSEEDHQEALDLLRPL